MKKSAVDIYYTDRHQWLLDQACALDEGRIADVDRLRLVQVIEGMAQDDYDTLSNFLAWIAEHLFELMIDDCEVYCRDRNHWMGAIAGYREKAKQLIENRKSMKKDSWQWNEAIHNAHKVAFAKFSTKYKGRFDVNKITKDFRFDFETELMSSEYYPARPECEEICKAWNKQKRKKKK